jgi:hypothetical protein
MTAAAGTSARRRIKQSKGVEPTFNDCYLIRMDCTQYLVLPCEPGGRMTRLDSRAAGPYATRDFALRVAIAEALRLRAAGRGIRIAADGTICAEQCLCQRFTPLNV